MSAIALGVATPVLAAANDGTVIEEIVVTARKREEKLQDVPLAITAVTAKDLQESRVENLADIAAQTPGLVLPRSSTETGGAGVIRGVNSLGGGDPTVAVFMDGVYLGNPTSVSLGVMDMARIEVVKGPVSALYGRAGYAGAINYVTQTPGKDLMGHVTATVGNGGKTSISGSVSGPVIGDTLSMGLSLNWDKFDGTYKDDVNGLKAGGHEKKDGRISFSYTPNDKAYVRGGYYYGEDFFDLSPNVTLTNNCGLPNADPVIGLSTFNQYCGAIKVTRALEVAPISSTSGQTGNNRKVTIANITGGYDLGWADLQATAGYTRTMQRGFADFTYFRTGIPFRLSPSGNIVNLFELFGSDNNNEDKSIEAKLTSKQDQQLRWIAGVYASSQQSATSTIIGLDRSKLPAGQSINSSATLFLTADGSPSTTNKTLVDSTDKQYALFGSFDYDFMPNLTLTAETRYVHQTKSQDILRNSFIANTLRPYGAIGTTAADFNFTTYRTNLRYKFSDHLMTYVAVATGAKAGGFNTRATIASEIAYQPEFNTTYEAGVKGTFLDGRLQANLALYEIKARGLQVQGVSDDPKNVGLVTKNFGANTNKGGELEIIAIPMTGVKLNFGLAYVDPIFDAGAYDFSTSNAVCLAIAACGPGRLTTITVPQGTRTVIKLEGNQVPGTSKVLANLGAEFRGDLPGEWTWMVRLDGRYESKRYINALNYNWVPNRTTADLHASVEKDHITIGAYVENLTDDDTPVTASPNTRLSDFQAHLVAPLPDGRQYGVSLTYKY
ncbi:TonB-dependent receptor [Phenylobacterium aquaticum]|uniref:TonB-dependent receptor n=1 Tax=Phenylobacterium aquaticum TaxID=1763816 RepID=UPI0026F2857F|nr:TonB-dependent receptor [Phenylobacterium aquaticum]